MALWVVVPDMWLAVLSIVLFIAVVVTSLVAVRRRLPYEFWYVVHLLTYAAVLTSLPHQFSVGGLFAEGTWQRWYWLAICIATGAALAHYRFSSRLLPRVRHQLRVSRVVEAAPGVVSIEMTGRHSTSWPEPADGSSLALSGPGHVVAPAPVQPLRRALAVRRRRPWPAADYRPESWQGIGPAGGAETRDPGGGRGAVRALQHRGPQPEPRRDDWRGHRHHPDPRPAGGTPFAPGNATVILRGHSESGRYLGDEILELGRSRGATVFHLTGPRFAGEPSWLPDRR